MQQRSIGLEKITMGVCYYPEHWDEALWADDLARMEKAGISVIRIAEFAWSKFEPEEGVFTFDFFDRFMALVAKTPIQVIFCTPTATPPAWATHNYPEILNAKMDGTLYHHGARRHYNFNSEKYRQLTRVIVQKLAEHYGQHPSIIGWQLDNEFNCDEREYYSESDTAQFRLFLKRKYGSIQALNQAWGTVFWNQDYNAWEQVFVPRVTPHTQGNPHQLLDYLRFISHSTRRYAKLQADILRPYIGERFITTNGLFSHLDNHTMTQESLDFITYDSYPSFAYALGANPLDTSDLNDRKWSRNLSETRSISPQFGIMEQQSGSGGSVSRVGAPMPKPGQAALWTMQSVAHGADFVSYFRWRTCTFGSEIYWHGILDYDNRDNRRLAEITSVARQFDALQPVAGAKYLAAFAVLKEYDNVWDAEYDHWHRHAEEVSTAGWFQAAQLSHTPMDYLYLAEDTTLVDLQQYPLLVYPHATILHPHTASLLTQYVQAGGTLVLGCRTGYKNANGHCVMQPKPGLLADLCGVQVEEFTLVGPGDAPVGVDWEGQRLEAAAFNDVLVPTQGGEVLARFDTSYYVGKPALVRRQHGSGAAYYYGAAFTQQAATAFLQKLGVAGPWASAVTLPESCELAVRQAKDGSRYLFVLNYLPQEASFTLHQPMLSLLDGTQKQGEVTLPAYGTAVYKM